MKSISFEQLKNMLKPMSHTIFQRIQALSSKIQEQDDKIDNARNELKNEVSGLSGKIYIGKDHPSNLVNKTELTAWKDITGTTKLTYDEGLKLLLNGAHLAGWRSDNTGEGREIAFVINWIDIKRRSYAKTIEVQYAKYTNSGEAPVVWTAFLTFEDSTTITD